jgi:hypothetical protein
LRAEALPGTSTAVAKESTASANSSGSGYTLGTRLR